jgi:excisionase family DNA binding protein
VREAEPRRRLTPPELARQLGVSADKILGWIRDGSLRAVNVATTTSGRPRWVIDLADLAAFEETRVSRAQTPKISKRRAKAPAGVIRFF